jgi:hypothetical protein
MDPPHLWMQVEKWKAARDKKERLHTAYNKIAMKDRLWPAVKEVFFPCDTPPVNPLRLASQVVYTYMHGMHTYAHTYSALALRLML